MPQTSSFGILGRNGYYLFEIKVQSPIAYIWMCFSIHVQETSLNCSAARLDFSPMCLLVSMVQLLVYTCYQRSVTK